MPGSGRSMLGAAPCLAPSPHHIVQHTAHFGPRRFQPLQALHAAGAGEGGAGEGGAGESGAGEPAESWGQACAGTNKAAGATQHRRSCQRCASAPL